MPRQPNILFLMVDQMQARTLDPESPCQTPNMDRLAQRGVRFLRAYTPNAVCSPARASLMTGRLPHNHGVCTVTGDVDPDKCMLRREHPHWAQRLLAGGYRTGYFGKWHVELSETPGDFGWEVDHGYRRPPLNAILQSARNRMREAGYAPVKQVDTPGYLRSIFYGVTDIPAEERQMGLITQSALEFLDESLHADRPWCCMVSFPEPHDPFIAGRDAYEAYDVDALPLPANVHDSLNGRPAVYRKMRRIWNAMTDREHREARACYFASITEIDRQFGRLIQRLETAQQLENTLVIMTADHGELLGAHGMYYKGFTAAEEIYNIPLIVAGPGVAQKVATVARVGLHDLAPTILELAGCESIGAPDSQSFAPVLKNPQSGEKSYQSGYAEYHGSRIPMLQRIAWLDRYKYVLNGFDNDELYDLQADPLEMNNLMEDLQMKPVAERLLTYIWDRIVATGDSLQHAQYPMWRIASMGPLAPSAR